MRVDFTVPEQLLGEVTMGQPATFGLTEDAFPYQGQIIGIDPKIDPQTRLVSVRATVENSDGELRPGQFVRVRVELPAVNDVIALPQTAVVTSLYGDYVYVVAPADAPAEAKPAEGDATLRQSLPRAPTSRPRPPSPKRRQRQPPPPRRHSPQRKAKSSWPSRSSSDRPAAGRSDRDRQGRRARPDGRHLRAEQALQQRSGHDQQRRRSGETRAGRRGRRVVNFSELFIRRPVLTIVTSILVLLLGIQGFFNMTVREYPEVEESVITVTTTYPGASASLMQGFITTPIAKAVLGADNVDYVTSSSTLGSSTVSVNMVLNADPDQALVDVLAKVQQVRGQLPDDAEDPVVVKGTGQDRIEMALVKVSCRVGTDTTQTAMVVALTGGALQVLSVVAAPSQLPGAEVVEVAMRVSQERVPWITWQAPDGTRLAITYEWDGAGLRPR